MERTDGRSAGELRSLHIIPHFIPSAAGSVLLEMGNTRVICTATVEEQVPTFLLNQNRGWVTAEYDMLPASTGGRKPRAAARGKLDARATEIQRLIGRSLRGTVDFYKMGPRTVWIDCDVIQADGGTRTASVTGGYVALALCVAKLMEEGKVKENPLNSQVAAVSVGIVDGVPLLDLCYQEDSRAQVDMNLVMTERGQLVEIQGTGEESPFAMEQLHLLLELGQKGIHSLCAAQRGVLESAIPQKEHRPWKD